MRRSFLVGIIFVSILFCGLSVGAVYGATVNPEKQTKKFLVAVQKMDFKTIFDTTYYYQSELSRIRSNNPKVLWQKLTTEYYESKRNAFFGKQKESLPDAWIRFGGELFGTPTDPVRNISVLTNLLTPTSRWEVIESKREKHFDQWSGRQRDVFVVYVSLSYRTVEESPLIGSKVLNEAILGFVLDGKTGLYMRSSRVAMGDVYWELPMRGYGLEYKYVGGSILRLTFQLDGGKPGLEAGKPPYTYDLFFNDKPVEDFFRRYTVSRKAIGGLTFESERPLYWIHYGRDHKKREIEGLTGAQLRWGAGRPMCDFCLEVGIRHLAEFTWPPDISFPIRAQVVIRDSSTPQKQTVIEATISEVQQGFPKPWRSWSDTYWINIDGKMYLPQGYTIHNLEGAWQGVYFGRNPFSREYQKVSFEAEIQQYGWDIKGVVTEQDPKTGNIVQADIEGSLWENELLFSKNYRPKKFNHSLSYEGVISAEGKTIEGTWRSVLASGKWSMRKKEQPRKGVDNIPETSKQDAELQKLREFIIDQWRHVIQIPPPKRDWRELIALAITGKYEDYSALYLLGVNRRNLTSDALSAADKFLKRGDLKNAIKYAGLGARHYIESNELFNTSEQVFSGSVDITAQVLEAIYRGSTEAFQYGWYLMCGPKCYEVADYVFLMTDFAVDYGLEGMDEAKKNLIISGFVKTLLETGGVSKWIENRTTHLIGDSGLYGLMDKTINLPEFQKAFMNVLAESGAYATKEMAETGVKTVINNAINFIKGSSNLQPRH